MAATAALAGALYLSAPAVAITTPLSTTTTDEKTFYIVWRRLLAINKCLSALDPLTVQGNSGGHYANLTLGTDYFLDRLGGVITANPVTWPTGLGVGVDVQVSAGYYLPLRLFLTCKEYDLTVDAKNVDVTTLMMQFVARTRVQLDAKGTMTNFYDPTLVYGDEASSPAQPTQIYVQDPTKTGHNQYFSDIVATDIVTVAQFWSIAGNPQPSLMAWAKVSEDAIKIITGDVVGETVQWEGTIDADGHMIYRTGVTNPGNEYYLSPVVQAG